MVEQARPRRPTHRSGWLGCNTAIWAKALAEGYVIVTKDSDFASMRQRIAGPQILWLRVGNASTAKVITYLEAKWTKTLGFLEAGEPVVEA